MVNFKQGDQNWFLISLLFLCLRLFTVLIEFLLALATLKFVRDVERNVGRVLPNVGKVSRAWFAHRK